MEGEIEDHKQDRREKRDEIRRETEEKEGDANDRRDSINKEEDDRKPIYMYTKMG